jgi:hypothetical protein
MQEAGRRRAVSRDLALDKLKIRAGVARCSAHDILHRLGRIGRHERRDVQLPDIPQPD